MVVLQYQYTEVITPKEIKKIKNGQATIFAVIGQLEME